jgi:hypothetical protein
MLMAPKKILIRIVLLMFFIFIADRIGSFLHWYYTMWWFDMLMHFLGGLWLSLFFTYTFVRRNLLGEMSTRTVGQIILWVFLVSVLWEVFEFSVNNVIGRTPFSVLDTTSDLFFDMSGAFLVLFYFKNKIMQGRESKVQL